MTAGCPSARDRQTPYRQRDATPLVLLKEDQSCATFAWQCGVALQMANDIGPSCKKRSETVPPHQRPPHQKNPEISDFGHINHNTENTVVSKLITDRHFSWGELISKCRYRIVLPKELISITETDLWEFQQKISHYRYRFWDSLEYQLISITDTDFGLKTNKFCNHFSHNTEKYVMQKRGVFHTYVGRHIVGAWIGGVWSGHFQVSQRYVSVRQIRRKSLRFHRKAIC